MPHASRQLVALWILLSAASGCQEPEELTLSPLLEADDEAAVATRVHGLSATGFNAYVLGAIARFGGGSYLWQGDGVTRTITYRGSVLAKPYSSGVCHCVGATFQAYMSAFEDWTQKNGGDGTLKGLSVTDAKAFKSVWYVASGGTEGSKAALVKYSLGSAVASSGAQPGDFVQFWRNSGSGHSVVFSGWKMSGSTITGLTYWSCNSGGPGTLTETVGSASGNINPSRIHIARAVEPGTPRPPDLGPRPDQRPSPDRGRPDARPAGDRAAPRQDARAADRGPAPDAPPTQRDGPAPDGDLPTTGALDLSGGCTLTPAAPAWPGMLCLVCLGAVSLVFRSRRGDG